jgi:hypothetical protein
VLTLCEGPPRRLSPTLDLKVKIINQAQNLIDPNCRIEIVTSHQVDFFEVNQALEIAYTEAVTPSFGLKGGGYLSIEPTRALVACDVDLGNAPTSMTKSTKPLKAQTNALALTEVARRLRLSNLGGLVVVDLIGSRHDSDALTQGLRAAFGAEAKEIIVGPITRFGTYEFTRPWGATPHKDQVSWPLSKAQHLLWAAVTEAQSDAGSLISIRAPSKILETVQKAMALSHDPLGPRLRLEADERLVPLVRRI